jgi:sugar transferase (PEP-CTERM/EpsH1 system associated)
MGILFLSHCVPNPPDKGEKIRAHYELTRLAAKYEVHLACFARSRAEMEDARKLEDRCASVYVEPLAPRTRLARAAAQFATGKCLMTSFYGSSRMREHVDSLRRTPLSATVAYSAAMAQYAPPDLPLLLDMVDVDSEKWFQYGQMRFPGWLYRMEGRRLRQLEIRYAARAAGTFLSTWHETDLFQSFAAEGNTRCMENGVDFDYFDPALECKSAVLANRRFIAFVGAMDYYPNADAACWFAAHVFRAWRKRHPEMEFLVVGRNPSQSVRRLSNQPGIAVTGSVPDVRPYLSAAQAVVAPLRMARGVQNKVLEALAMGKCVLASNAVCVAFGTELPLGVLPCRSESDYVHALERTRTGSPLPPATIRGEARRRFSWSTNLKSLTVEVESVLSQASLGPARVTTGGSTRVR